MAPRTRVLTFGSAAVLVVAGALCGILVSGVVGEVLAIGLVLLGLGGALLLLFFEVGLSEDRDRAREDERRRERAARRVHPGRRPRFQWPRRPG